MKTIGSAHVRAQNSSLVLKTVWCEQEISRAQLSRELGLSRSTVSAIVHDLLETSLVADVGTGRSSGGRKPVLVGFKDDAFGLIGVDMGRTNIGVALTNLRGKVLDWRHARIDVTEAPDAALGFVKDAIRECMQSDHECAGRVVGIGMGLPSPIDAEHPGKLSSLILPAWSGYDVQEILSSAFDLPVFLDNDANLGALAELWWGAGRDGGDLVYVKVGTGVGSGHIIGGQIYRGSAGYAGEIGHITVERKDSALGHLQGGALHDLAGSPALLARARLLLAEHPGSLLAQGELSIPALVEATLTGDLVARQVVEEAGEVIGIAVANLLNILNPATVVLGGELTAVGDLLLHPLRQSVRQRTLWAAIARSRIVTSELGARAISVGAATLVLQAILEDPALCAAADVSISAERGQV